jgi:hypothetical protein
MSTETTFDDARPVFLVGDIAATMQWYSKHLGFDVRGVPDIGYERLARQPSFLCVKARKALER